MKLLFFIAPPLAENWPGPLGRSLTDDHRLAVGIAYGLIGWLVGRLIFRWYGGWHLRLPWLVITWCGWSGVLFVIGKILSIG